MNKEKRKGKEIERRIEKSKRQKLVGGKNPSWF